MKENRQLPAPQPEAELSDVSNPRLPLTLALRGSTECPGINTKERDRIVLTQNAWVGDDLTGVKYPQALVASWNMEA